MKKSKNQQLRIRISEDQLRRLSIFLIDHPSEYNSKSDLVRSLIEAKICRDRRGNNSSTKQNKNTPTK